MPGFTKNQSIKFMTGTQESFTEYIKKIIPTLPIKYNIETIIKALEDYYPYEWLAVNETYNYFEQKDHKLVSLGKKIRHCVPQPKVIIKSLAIMKKITSEPYMRNHEVNYDNNKYITNMENLRNIRLPKISRIKEKIEKAKLKVQLVEPFFLSKLMGLYDKKDTPQKDRVYIMKELEKYYCPQVILFFKKKADTEYNRQLRVMAFSHLQGFGHIVSLRRQKYIRIPSCNVKRRNYLKNCYANERFNIEATPQELEYRINNSKEQNLKRFDFFVSHSSTDFEEVQKMIKYLNSNGRNIYCDWINDTNYLKRSLVGEATRSVIELRLKQSENVLLISSEIALKSDWVRYELNFFHSLGKQIYVIDKKEIT